MISPPGARQACAARGLARLEGALSITGAAALAGLLVVVLAAVIARYAGTTALAGADELALWLYVGLVFIGIALIADGPLAMRLDLLEHRLRGRPRALLQAFAQAITVQSLLVLVVGAARAGQLVGGTSATLGVPEAWRYAVVAVGAVLGLIAWALRASAAGGAEARMRWLGGAVGVLGYVALHALAPQPLATPSAVAAAVAAVALLAGAPLPHSLIAGLAWTLPAGGLLPEPALVQNMLAGVDRFLLLAIPFFLLAGVLMVAGGLAERLVRLASALVGHRRAGLAQTTLLTNLMFSGVAGSSIADAGFGAKVLAPALIARGYRPEHAAAITAATSVLPNIVPPSIAFLILAAVANLSVGALFQGGLVAGLFLAAVLALALQRTSHEQAGAAPASGAERRAAARAALPVLGLALIVVAGIRFGVVTTTEAAALAAGYALAVALVVRPELRGRALVEVLGRTAAETSAVGLLIASAAPVVSLLAIDQVPAALGQALQWLGAGPLAVMLLANLMLLAAGCVLDIGAAILLLAPLMLPVAVAAGIDPIHFGVVLVVNLMIGGLTPPVGVLVYVTAGAMGLPPRAVFRACAPLISALVAALAVLALAAAGWALLR